MVGRLIAILIDVLALLLMLADGLFVYLLTSPFVAFRKGRWPRLVLLLLYSGSCGMVIWIGDPNMIYTMLVFFPCFFLVTQGQFAHRLALAMISFCYIMSACAIIDSYAYMAEGYDYIVRLLRPVAFGGIYFFFRKRLPCEPVSLSSGMWKLMLGLSAMPFFSLVALWD